MSGYFKRVLILKTLDNNKEKCVVKVESSGSFLSVTADVYYGDKNYLLAISVDGIFYMIKIGKNARVVENFSAFQPCENASALLVEKENFAPIAYGFLGDKFLDFNTLLTNLKTCETPPQESYNDELIAENNYYNGEINETKPIYCNATGKDGEGEGKKEEKESRNQPLFYEKGDCGEQNKRYYDTIREKIEEILLNHPEDLELKRAVGCGRFCKINYDDERYYSVGIVDDCGEVKYIVYAVPGSYSNVPSELKRFARFIPMSPFFSLGPGYYAIFQNALTGEIVSF